MSFDIVSKLADFKKSILYENRFFITNHPFLVEFNKLIKKDLESKNPIMISNLREDSILYRARVMDQHLGCRKSLITKMMQQYSLELEQAKCCKECDQENTNCVKASTETAEKFKSYAKEELYDIALSSEVNFQGFNKCDSSLPPKEKSEIVSDMRANPRYIRYLYAANDKYTALLEARSNINSLVSVADIKISKHLRIFDITNLSECKDKASNLFELLYELNDEFSVPVAGELKDYLTSQVISEFIKNLDCVPKFDGICFKSSLNPRGKNYTLFNEENFQPISSEVYYISEIGLTAHGVTESHGVSINSYNPNSYI